MVIPILLTIFTFGFMIFVHELGHFIMARRAGVRVLEFSLGLGPRLFGIKKGDTDYSIKLIPFGGEVRLEGSDTQADASDPNNLESKSAWVKMKVFVGGCLMNYLIGILLFWFVGIFYGVANFDSAVTNRVGIVLPGKPAERAGIRPGDVITEIDGLPMKDGESVMDYIHQHPEKKLTINLQRKKEILNIAVTSESQEFDTPTGKKKMGVIGFMPDHVMIPNFKKVPVLTALQDGLDKALKFTVGPFVAIAMIVKKQLPAQMVVDSSGGPILIFQMILSFARKGIFPLLYFAAIINILIGFMNLMPFPGLDGAHVLFLVIGLIRKKPIDPEKENMIHNVGLIILLVLVLLLSYQDVLRIIQGRSFIK
ncbi:MAG: M50 family metallopeptidase [bacterium]